MSGHLGGAFLALAAIGCSAGEAASNGLDDLGDEVRDVAQGCSWREAPADFSPRSTSVCWRIYTQRSMRVSLEPLADVCDAAELPTCLALHGSEQPYGFFDWKQTDRFEILRYERSPNCEPCE